MLGQFQTAADEIKNVGGLSSKKFAVHRIDVDHTSKNEVHTSQSMLSLLLRICEMNARQKASWDIPERRFYKTRTSYGALLCD